MKCKVFDCPVAKLEEVIQGWLTASFGLSIVETTTLGITSQTGLEQTTHNVLLLVFYTDTLKDKKKLPQVDNDQLPKCPECERVMQVRANRSTGDLFFGCVKYPECTGTRKFTDEDRVQFGGELPKPQLKLPPVSPQKEEELRIQKSELQARLSKSRYPSPPEGHGPHDGPDDDDIPF